jgi:hypothetical protein
MNSLSSYSLPILLFKNKARKKIPFEKVFSGDDNFRNSNFSPTNKIKIFFKQYFLFSFSGKFKSF